MLKLIIYIIKYRLKYWRQQQN